MNKRSLARRLAVLTAAALLAALAGCLMHTYDSSAPERVVTGETSAAPVEDSEKQEKPLTAVCGFGVRPASLMSNTAFAADDLPYLRHWRAKVGVAPEDVEAFAVVYFDDGGTQVLLVRTRGDVPQGNVMMACEAGRLTKMACGAKVYTGENSLAVHFPQRRVAMVVDGVEMMERCLTRLPELLARLDDAGKHDLTAWHDQPADEFPCGLRSPTKTQSPLIAKMQRMRLWADVGLTFDAGVEVDFADEESARASKALLAGGGDLSYGALVASVGYLRALEVMGSVPDQATNELMDLAPKDLLVRAAKGLHKARVDSEGRTASLTFRVPLTLADRPAFTKLFAHPAVRKEDDGAGPGLVFAKKRSQPDSPRAAAGAAEASEEVTVVPPPPDDVPRTATLTVANVRKEDLVLFVVDDKGELSSPRKVPAGDALDVAAAKGQRFVAVFLSEPFREAYTVSQSKAVWLIRPAPAPEPVPVKCLKPR